MGCVREAACTLNPKPPSRSESLAGMRARGGLHAPACTSRVRSVCLQTQAWDGDRPRPSPAPAPSLLRTVAVSFRQGLVSGEPRRYPGSASGAGSPKPLVSRPCQRGTRVSRFRAGSPPSRPWKVEGWAGPASGRSAAP